MADSVEQVVYENLTSDSVFMAFYTGVYWLQVDKNVTPTEPYIVFWMVDDIGAETRLNKAYQGEARIQFDLWDSNKIRGARLRTTLREKVRNLSDISGGYTIMTSSVNEQTIQRLSETDPFHFVVDGIIKWNKE